MKPMIFSAWLLLIVAVGCGRENPQPPVKTAAVQTYDVHGIVRAITPDRRTATIQHQAVPGYMGAMTMDFTVKDTNDLKDISPDDEITFKLVVGEDDDWIEGVHFVAHHISEVTSNAFVFHADTDELKVGDALPDGELTTESGATVHFSDFHGRALAFTFFFTSCPLPDFCPRMNKNFAEARRILLADSHAPTNWEFLSISFDPDFDRPEILTGYAGLYREGNTNRWLFAAAPTNTLAELAPRVDLHFWRENGSISHNLRTVVLDPNGKITRQFDSNDWTAQDLADAIRDATKVPVQ